MVMSYTYDNVALTVPSQPVIDAALLQIHKADSLMWPAAAPSTSVVEQLVRTSSYVDQMAAAIRLCSDPQLLRNVWDDDSRVKVHQSILMNPHCPQDLVDTHNLSTKVPSNNTTKQAVWASIHARQPLADLKKVGWAATPARAIIEARWRHHRPEMIQQMPDVLEMVPHPNSRHALLADLAMQDLAEGRNLNWLFGPKAVISTELSRPTWQKIRGYDKTFYYLPGARGTTTRGMLSTPHITKMNSDGSVTYDLDIVREQPIEVARHYRTRAAPLWRAAFGRLLYDTFGDDLAEGWPTARKILGNASADTNIINTIKAVMNALAVSEAA